MGGLTLSLKGGQILRMRIKQFLGRLLSRL